MKRYEDMLEFERLDIYNQTRVVIDGSFENE